MQEGEQYGLVLNFDKTIVLLGKCRSNEEAVRMQRAYLDRGMHLENVLIHPDDVSNGEKQAQGQLYGVACLGVPIGCQAFVDSWLKEKLCVLKGMANSIVSFNGTRQNKLLMMRFRFAQKWTVIGSVFSVVAKLRLYRGIFTLLKGFLMKNFECSHFNEIIVACLCGDFSQIHHLDEI
jgi:hypothetical protein